MSSFRTCVASPPNREKLVVKIDSDAEEWAEINQETGKFIIEIYPKQDNKPWVFDYEETMKVLVQAKKRLKEARYKSIFFPKRQWWKIF